jgi:hypothetical protein
MMRFFTACLLLICLVSKLFSAQEFDFSNQPEETEALYQMGSAARDGVFNSLSASMLGWGVGLAAGIAVLSAVLHQSHNGHND